MRKINYLFVLALLISACTTNGRQSNNSSIDDSDCIIKENTTIEFLCMLNGKYRQQAEEFIASFEQKEPHVKVILSNPQGSGNYAMLEKTVISGFFKEDYPDIVQCYPDNVVKYIAKGKVVNLNPYLNNGTYGLSDEDKTDYIADYMNKGADYKVEGMYSLPYCKSTELMYYNADELLDLQIEGVNGSNPIDENYLNNLTWEELFENLCPKLEEHNATLPENEKILTGTDSQAIVTYDSDENFFITLAKQYGYGFTSYDKETDEATVDFDNDGMKNIIKQYRSYRDKNYFETKGSLGDYVSSLFISGDSLFTISSTAGLAYNYNEKNPFKVGVARIPKAAAGDYCSIIQGPSVCILDHNDENRALASYLLWKHMTDKENDAIWSLKTGYMGLRNSFYTSDLYKDSLVIKDETNLLEVAEVNNRIKIEEYKDFTFDTPAFGGSSNARTNVGLLVRDCLTVEDLESKIDTIFKDYADDATKYVKKVDLEA